MTESQELTRSATQTLAEPGQSSRRRATDPDLEVPGAGLERGEAIGRYLVLDRIGAGAMGVVFAAYDPELDRKVAIKVLHLRREGEEAQARLVREAQALARVTHAGVVAVHDVGVHEGRVFLAMEYVEGQTLRSFLADPERGLDERLKVMIAAGEGLAAAHAAGLVHRDFKPDNVMISARGEVKVMDFGLARARDGGSSGVVDLVTGSLGAAASETSSSPTAKLAAAGELTEVGAVVGTPAYMAPEQLSGLAADARSDQFAFAVTVHEALFGLRPFSGANLAALALAISEGRIDEGGNPRKVPAWLRKVVLRGLASEPSERWPNLEAMLRALQEDPREGRAGAGRWAVTGVVAAGFLGLLGWQLVEPTPTPAPACSELVAGLDGAWSDARRSELDAALVADASTRGAAATVVTSLDRYAADWDAANLDNCASTKLRASQSERLYDLRAACLRHRRIAFGSTASRTPSPT